jgi:hypothetical protein
LARGLLTRCSRSNAGFLLAVASVSLLCASAGQRKEPEEAWWLDAKFTPVDTAYEGLSVSAIDPEWVKVTVFSYAAMPTLAKADFGWMRQHRFAFQVDQHFKRPGSENRVLCRVFEARTGQRGRFLVLERTHGSPWKPAFVHKETGEPGFSVLVRNRSGLYWGICIQCDEFERLEFKKGKYSPDPTTAAP